EVDILVRAQERRELIGERHAERGGQLLAVLGILDVLKYLNRVFAVPVRQRERLIFAVAVEVIGVDRAAWAGHARLELFVGTAVLDHDIAVLLVGHIYDRRAGLFHVAARGHRREHGAHRRRAGQRHAVVNQAAKIHRFPFIRLLYLLGRGLGVRRLLPTRSQRNHGHQEHRRQNLPCLHLVSAFLSGYIYLYIIISF